jgi:hypothetical protein
MLKVFLASFGCVLGVGAIATVGYLHFHQDAGRASDSQRALASMPTPTGGGNSSDLQSPNVPFTNARNVQSEDDKNRAAQNWKADHVKAAGPGDSNVTAEDMQELQDTENAQVQPVNRPK